ncbi:MAG: hypothetical protein GXO97_10165 [Nitrospirae bacterium]|nr:hypothetical protein [Nitrospirota bacterium]
MSGIVKLFVSRLTVHTLDQAKRIIRIVVGFTLLIIGVALIVLPGPATLVIPAALAILAGEFVWARKLLKKFNYGITHGLSFFRRKRRK